MTKVGIVCDSTCDMGTEWIDAHELVTVPLKVTFGDETFRDWLDMSSEQFFARLARSSVLPKTSQPSPAQFLEAYERLAASGCDQIVSIHCSAALSGTYTSALIAADTAPIPVRVIDTCTASAGKALLIEAAVVARDTGADAAGVEAAVRSAMSTSHIYFALDTLDYFVKGGRAGRVAGLAVHLLKIKPVLTVTPEGTITLHKRLRGTARTIREMAEVVRAASVNTPVRIAMFHSVAPELIERLLKALDAAGARYTMLDAYQTGAVIGTYAGPRALGIAFYSVP